MERELCLKFINNPTKNPYNGKKLVKYSLQYQELIELCKINGFEKEISTFPSSKIPFPKANNSRAKIIYPFIGCDIDLNFDIIINEIIKDDMILFHRFKSTCKYVNGLCNADIYYKRLYNKYYSNSDIIDFNLTPNHQINYPCIPLPHVGLPHVGIPYIGGIPQIGFYNVALPPMLHPMGLPYIGLPSISPISSMYEYKLVKFTNWYDAFKLCLSLDILVKSFNKGINSNEYKYTQRYIFREKRLLFSDRTIILQNAIGILKHVENVIINSCRIESLPRQLGELSNLTSMDLSKNKIETLPKELCMLSKLQFLNLTSNQIKCFPSEFFTLPNLSSVYLSDNQIELIPSDVKQLTRLTSLLLTNNKLLSVPNEIGSLINLCYLDISGNNINNIPLSFNKLTNLETFNYDKRLVKNTIQKRWVIEPI